MTTKILEGHGYGHISHLPGSQVGTGDHQCEPGQARICTERTRDRFDRVIVQEKLDGGNVGVVKQNGVCIPVTRSGNHAASTSWPHHHLFAWWVTQPEAYQRFDAVLREGERLMGEWLAMAHGTLYSLQHEPFVAFDLMVGVKRVTFDELSDRLTDRFVMPHVVSDGAAIPVDRALALLGPHGFHGAVGDPEGLVYRVERNGRVLFLAKFVRGGKLNGCYLPKVSGREPVWNWRPDKRIAA